MGIDKDWSKVPVVRKDKSLLTKQNTKFLKLIVAGFKTIEAYRAAGYKGSDMAAYALKHHLKTQLAQRFEHEGISPAKYQSELLKLLSLPCRDPKGNPLTSLTFNQHLEILKLLRDELPENKNKVGSITAFTVQRFEDGRRATKKDRDEESTGGVVDMVRESGVNIFKAKGKGK